MHVDVCGCTMRLAAATLLAALIMSPISPGRERVGGSGRRHGEMGRACPPITRRLVVIVSKDKGERTANIHVTHKNFRILVVWSEMEV